MPRVFSRPGDGRFDADSAKKSAGLRMNTRRLLIAFPIVLIAVLLQASFWVPTYEHQETGNPRRLTTYIQAGIGDAKMLNPTISSDGASTQISSHIFESLLTVDEELNLTGELAERWEMREVAYLAVVPGRRLPDGTAATAQEVARRIRTELAGGSLGELADALEAVRVLPAETRERTLSLTEEDASGEPTQREVAARAEVPARVEFRLNRVVQDLFDQLEPVLGATLLAEDGVEAYLQVDAEGESLEALRPQLAELLSVTEHNPVLIFHLRHGARWHDGHPFDADDVRFTYDAIMNPKNLSPRTSYFDQVKALEVLDAHTVRVVYKRLYSPAIIAWVYMSIVPEHRLDAAAMEREMDRRGIAGEARENFGLRNSETIRHPIGTGPFRFIEWQSDQFIHLARNDDYWKGPPEYTDLYYRVIPEIVTQEIEFRAGAVDYYGALPHQVARYREDERYQAISALRTQYTYIGFNLRKPLFADARVRRALGMAINVDELIRYVLYGEAERTSGPYYRTTPFYNPDTPLLPYDPDGARALLAEAGWAPGPDGILEKDGQRFEFALITNNGNLQRKAVMTIAQNAWRRLGIDVRTQALEWTVFLEDFIYAGAFDAMVLAWGGGALDPDLYELWHSSRVQPYQLNRVGYANPVADDLMDRIREEYDPETRRALAFQLHDVIAADQPYIFLYAPRATWVLDRKIVIVRRDPQAPGGERYQKIYPIKSGDITYHFERWRKLASAPHFAVEP